MSHFGTNKKDPPVRTKFCVFFMKAIDDFMLKLLLVCACVNIGFEVGFAEDNEHRKIGKSLTLNALFACPLSEARVNHGDSNGC